MAEFFKTSTLWVVEFRYQGRARRWFKTFGTDVHAESEITAMLRDLYGDRACLVALRRATPEEEAQYVRGDVPKNAYCPTGAGQ